MEAKSYRAMQRAQANAIDAETPAEVREAVQNLAGLPQKRPILMETVPKKAGLPHFRGSTQHGNSFEMCRRGRVAGS